MGCVGWEGRGRRNERGGAVRVRGQGIGQRAIKDKEAIGEDTGLWLQREGEGCREGGRRVWQGEEKRSGKTSTFAEREEDAIVVH